MSTGGGAGDRWERLKDGVGMRAGRKSCWQRREGRGGFRELALKNETQSHQRPGGRGEVLRPRETIVWQSGVGTCTHLVTSGPPILSGSSETLGEERGPECLIWTQGASSPPTHWPQGSGGPALAPGFALLFQAQVGARSEMVSAGRRKGTGGFGRRKKQAGGQRHPHGEGATHTHLFLKLCSNDPSSVRPAPFKAAPSLPHTRHPFPSFSLVLVAT